MGLMNEYIDRKMSGNDLEVELLKLIRDYNKVTGNELLVYSAAISKPIPNISLNMEDYYIIADLLDNPHSDTLDVYIETPGGSAEAAEEIVRYLHTKFKKVNFIVSGEAKSAGTLMVLAGNNIAMTKTGSLGPIDAQVRIGRGQVSAHDYMQWVDAKQKSAGKEGKLNPFDATMIAQISPGELYGVDNALEFAHDLVVKWLPKYKFKDWKKTETSKKVVSNEDKKVRAKEIAESLTDHSRWRSHGRSLKITDLKRIGLKIDKLEDKKDICDIVSRIQVVLRMLFSTTTIYKAIATEESKIFGTATSANPAAPMSLPQNQELNSARIEVPCAKCGKVHRLYAKLKPDPKIDTQLKAQGFVKIPGNAKLICECGFEMDLTGIKNQLESDTGKKVLQ